MGESMDDAPRHARLFELLRQGDLAARARLRIARRDGGVEASSIGASWSPEALAATLSAA